MVKKRHNWWTKRKLISNLGFIKTTQKKQGSKNHSSCRLGQYYKKQEKTKIVASRGKTLPLPPYVHNSIITTTTTKLCFRRCRWPRSIWLRMCMSCKSGNDANNSAGKCNSNSSILFKNVASIELQFMYLDASHVTKLRSNCQAGSYGKRLGGKVHPSHITQMTQEA